MLFVHSFIHSFIYLLQNTIADRVHPVDVYDFSQEIIVRDTDKSRKIWNDLYRIKKKEWRTKDLDYFANVK